MAQCIVITGFMAAGKTTAARLAAEDVLCQLVDLDRSIEEATGKSIAQIFAEDGEAAFRKIESHQLALALNAADVPGIIAAGGGVVLTAANQLLLKRACVIFLDTDFTEILRRLQSDQTERPLLRGLDATAIRQLWQSRRQLYIKSCDFVVKDSAELIKLVNSKIQRG